MHFHQNKVDLYCHFVNINLIQFESTTKFVFVPSSILYFYTEFGFNLIASISIVYSSSLNSVSTQNKVDYKMLHQNYNSWNVNEIRINFVLSRFWKIIDKWTIIGMFNHICLKFRWFKITCFLWHTLFRRCRNKRS